MNNYINNIDSVGEWVRLDHQARLVGKVSQPTAIGFSFPTALNSVKCWMMRARGKVGSHLS